MAESNRPGRCDRCGSTSWRAHGTYAVAGGREVRRWRCGGCGRTTSHRPSVGPRKATFFRVGLLRFTAVGLPGALGAAARRVDVSPATASRWVASVDLDALREAMAVGPTGDWSRARWELFSRALDTYRRSPDPPTGGKADRPRLELRGEDSTAVWRVLAEARAVASVLRAPARAGNRVVGRRKEWEERPAFPFWLDRLAPGASRVRESALPSEWSATREAIADFGEVVRRVASPTEAGRPSFETFVRCWEEPVHRGWLFRRVFLRHAGRVGSDPWMSGEVGWGVRGESVDLWLRSHGVPVGVLPVRLVSKLDRVLDRWGSAVSPSRLQRLDDELEAPLRYWVSVKGGRCFVAVATRRRVVGKASAELDGFSDEDDSSWTGWFRPRSRVEHPGAWTVAIPVRGGGPLVLEVGKDAVTEWLGPS